MTKLPQMDVPEPPAPLAPPPPVKQPGKLRTYITFAVLAVVVAVIGFAIANNKDAGELAVGTCFDRPTSGQDFSTVSTHKCTEEHDAEVVLVAEYTQGDTFPISLTLDRYMDDTCAPAALAYTGKAPEDLGDYQIGLFSPNLDGWNDGERTFTCYLLRADEGKITQSLKGGASAS